MYSPQTPTHPYHNYQLFHNPEHDVDHFRQIFALQFQTSEEAFDCCQRLARKCGFGVRRRTSKSCTVYIVCSREGRPETKKDGVRKRNRTSERCNCDWRVVLFLTDKKLWEFRAGKCMVHNHHLIPEDFRNNLDNQKRHQRTASAPIFLPSNLSQNIVATPPPSPPKNALEAAQRMQTMPMFAHNIFHPMSPKSHTVDVLGNATHARQMLPTPYLQGGTQLPYPSDGRSANGSMYPAPLVDLQPMYDPHLFPSSQHLLGLGLYQPGMIPYGQKMFMHSHGNGQQFLQKHEPNDHHAQMHAYQQPMAHTHHQLPPLQGQLQQMQMQMQFQQQQQPQFPSLQPLHSSSPLSQSDQFSQAAVPQSYQFPQAAVSQSYQFPQTPVSQSYHLPHHLPIAPAEHAAQPSVLESEHLPIPHSENLPQLPISQSAQTSVLRSEPLSLPIPVSQPDHQIPVTQPDHLPQFQLHNLPLLTVSQPDDDEEERAGFIPQIPASSQTLIPLIAADGLVKAENVQSP